MPIAPTERLVVTGFNQFVRNPMYAGLLTAILGQALLFDSIWLVVYAVIGWIGHGIVRALVRRAHSGKHLRRAVRGVPPQCARMDAAAHPLEAAFLKRWGVALVEVAFGLDGCGEVGGSGAFSARHHHAAMFGVGWWFGGGG